MVLLHFGSGLVGGAIAHELSSTPRCRWSRGFNVPWNNHEAFSEFSSSVCLAIDSLRRDVLATSPVSLRIVWSAGNSKFSTNAENSELELQSFRRVIMLCRMLADHVESTDAHFHHISSIGGLFEGQRRVGPRSHAAPRRPYGELKWHQEEILEQISSRFDTTIYRLPSVFGFPIGGARWSLIARLIHDGVHGASFSLVPWLSVLRDYVWNVDIGRYVAMKALSQNISSRQTIYHLASGRPTSIIELLHRVEALCGKKLRYFIYRDWDNHRDITVDPKALPHDWQTTTLNVSIRQLYRQFLHDWATGHTARRILT